MACFFILSVKCVLYTINFQWIAHINRLDKYFHKTLNLFKMHVCCPCYFLYHRVANELCEEHFSENVFVYFLSIAVTVSPFTLLLPQSQSFISFWFEKRSKFVVGHFLTNCSRLVQCKIFQSISGLCVCTVHPCYSLFDAGFVNVHPAQCFQDTLLVGYHWKVHSSWTLKLCTNCVQTAE